MRVIIFDDLYSFFHFILGALTPIIGRLGLLLFLIYMVYQVVDEEEMERKIGDFFEFLAGVGGCYIILEVLKIF